MDLYFLQAGVPLTKTITKTHKIPYPMVKNFTSHKEEVTTPLQLFKAIEKHSKKNHCLLKGTLTRPLANESRANTTRSNDETEWICLDFDRFETPDIEVQLAAMDLGDVTYVLQYSSSHGLPENEGTVSAHVFMLLSEPLQAPVLKAWLMGQNLALFEDELRMSRDTNTLSWPLDITTCQNDKLLYIAKPVFQGIPDPVTTRLQLISKPLLRIPVERIGERHPEALKNEARAALNKLRKAAGLKPRVAGTSWVSGKEVQNKPTVAAVTGIKDCGEWVRLNLNDGDSWAYCHPKENFELIFDFKSESWYKTKELVPDYYAELRSQQEELNATPTDEGDLILAFRDLRTASYYNGFWNPQEQKLALYPAKNETQLDHWMRSHGRVIGDFIPVWDLQYNPREDWVVDEEEHKINTFQPTPFLKAEPRTNTEWPNILRIICHMLGEPNHTELVEHFLNWFACIFQRKYKPLTAFVAHGCEGTGKGYFANKIVSPLLGQGNFTAKTVVDIEDQFNAFLAGKLFCFVDEVDVDDFREKGRVTARLRNWITEPTISIREMRRVAQDQPNYVALFFSSNRPQPVFIPPTDRRYNVGNYQAQKLPRPDDDVVAGELMAFAEFLSAYKVNRDRANTPMQTEQRSAIQNIGLTSAEETAQSVMSGDLGALWLARTDERLLRESGVVNPVTQNAQAYNLLVERLIQEAFADKHGVLTRDELLVIFQYNVGSVPTSPNKFTSFLRHKGIATRRLRKNGELVYGMDVEWKLEDWFLEELRGKKDTRVRRVK